MYIIVDCFKEVVADSFNTATEAYFWMHKSFTDQHIKLYNFRIVKVKEED